MQNINNIAIGLLLLSILFVSSASIRFSTNATGANSSSASFAAMPSVNIPKIKVVASFYPVYEFVKKVGGDKVVASVLVPIGVEPHDFDPSIQQIQSIESSAVLVYNGGGMEGAWINKVDPKFAIDTSKGINLLTGNDSRIHAPT